MRKNVIRIALYAMLFALCLPAADAQQPAKVAKIGYLSPGSASGPGRGTEVLRLELRTLGYVEGKNITFEYRYADNRFDRLPALADELVRLKVDVLVVPSTPAALVAKNATKTIPSVVLMRAEKVMK